MPLSSRLALAAATVALFACPISPVTARDGKPSESAKPAAFQQLMDCRTIEDSANRLACFDRQVAILQQAEQTKEIVVADKNAIQEAKRGLFGFTAPVGRLFGLGGSADSPEDELKRIDTEVSSVRYGRGGVLRIAFVEGGAWEQTDTRNFAISPRAGQKAYILKGALGSFFVSVNGQPGIRMRRVQ